MSFTQIICRLVLAVIIGGAIGYEREYKNRPAGLRTHILVCLGAAIISMIQLEIVEDVIIRINENFLLKDILSVDIGRLGAQVVSGIGFIGAGTIMHQKGSIKGLTTAASLWAVACIGLAIGLGQYFLSVASVIVIVMILACLKKLENRIIEKRKYLKLELIYSLKDNIGQEVENILREQKVFIKNIEFEIYYKDRDKKKCIYTLYLPKTLSKIFFIDKLSTIGKIEKIRIIN